MYVLEPQYISRGLEAACASCLRSSRHGEFFCDWEPTWLVLHLPPANSHLPVSFLHVHHEDNWNRYERRYSGGISDAVEGVQLQDIKLPVL